jgi:ABC-type multidrug transport system fused ATPase/permease subunit
MLKKQIALIYRFFEPARLDKKESMKTAFASLLNSLVYDVLPIVTVPLLFVYVAASDTKSILGLTYIVTAILVCYFLVRLFFMNGWHWYAYLVFRAKIEQVYRGRILLKDNIIFETKGIGKIQSIVDRGISTWTMSIGDVIWYTVSMFVTTILGIYVLYKMGLVYILVFLGLLIFSCVWFYYFKHKQYKIKLEEYDTQTEYTATQIRTLMSRQEILYSNKIESESKKLHDLSMQSQKIFNKSDKYGTTGTDFIELIMILLPLVGVLVYFYLRDIRIASIEQQAFMTAFIVFSFRMSGMIWIFLSFVSRILKDFPDIKKFWDFLDETPNIHGYDEGISFTHSNGTIELQNTSFQYSSESTEVLQDFTLSIAGGSRVAFVGRSGSGKTTIAKLIAGYMRPTSGKVLVDGQDLVTVALKSYYPSIGYLTQEPMVFDGTIRENLLYAVKDSNISEQIISEALEKAQCDFVLKAEKGLDTQIGEKGVRLSGGEKQRLAIAKLLLKNPEIVILDEPTSALDSFSEDAVTRAMNELFVGRTVIIIAHRLQTVKSADRIIVLDAGKIVEEGTHQSLIQQGGTYARMLEMQSGF